jgi:hypothetical protein
MAKEKEKPQGVMVRFIDNVQGPVSLPFFHFSPHGSPGKSRNMKLAVS